MVNKRYGLSPLFEGIHPTKPDGREIIGVTKKDAQNFKSDTPIARKCTKYLING